MFQILLPKFSSRRMVLCLALLVPLFCLNLQDSYASGECDTPSFNSPPSFSAGQQPTAVAAGDLNADGKLDLIVANLTSDTFSLLFGDGAGGFLPPSTYQVGIPGGTVGAYPRAVAIGDMNGDGKPDLVVAGGYGPGWVSVLLGDGTGSFAVSVNQALGNGRAADVALGDFNGDGKKDVAVAGSDSYEIRFLLGNGAGAFGGVAHVTVTSEPTAIAAGDFNGDGISDVAVTNYYFAWGLSVVLGRADGNFILNQSITTRSRPTDIAVADFNQDGKLDLANAFSWADYGIEIRFGDGSGSFGAIANTITTSFDPVTLVATDFNNDTNPDLLVDISSASSVGLLLGQGNGQFAAGRYFSTLPDTALAMAVGDFNQDSKLDLVTTHSGANAVAVLLGDGVNAFAAPNVIVELNQRGGRIVTADFNSDGRADVAVPQAYGNYVLIYLNNAMGGVSAPQFWFIGRPAISMATGDFNHDNKADLVFGHDLTSGPSFVSVMLGNGSGGFSGPTTFNVGGLSNIPSLVIVTGNFDADSNPDLAVLLDPFVGTTKIALLRGDGAGGFSAPVYIDRDGTSGGLATADFNGDGKLDLGVAGIFPSVLTILQGDGLGSFSPGSSTPATSPGGDLRAADLNKDGRPDLISANPNTTQLLVFLNNGGGFNSAITIDTIGSPYGVAVADFNADTNLDMAVSSGSFQGNVAVFSGDGLGSFEPPVYFTAGGSGSITVADFNGDGRPDLATSNYVAVLLNTFEMLPCLSINDVAVTEGDAGSLNADFTVSLSSPSAQTVRVNYSLNGVNATAGADFTSVSGRLAFAPGEVTKTISVPILADTLDEFDETFKVTLASPSHAAISDKEGLGTILDNDPTPTLSVNDITVTEGGMSFSWNFTITLSAPSGRTITVQYATADGTAKAGTSPANDYFGTFGTLTIPAGQTTATVGVPVFGDNAFETDENFFLNLSNATNATISDAQGQATIPNDDLPPTVFVQDASVQEGNSGTQNALFTVTLSNPTYLPVSLDFTTTDDTATAGSDYVTTSGSVTLDPGEMFKTITVPVLGDTMDETFETYFVDISNAQNATITSPRAFGFINDDDGPTVSISDVSVTEGQSGTTDATFTLTLSAASVQTVSVRATTANGTATTANSDYSQRISTLSFPVGTLTRTFTVPVIGDIAVEANETFFVNLSIPSNLTIADGQGVGTIVNDDNTFQFSSATYFFNEDVGSGVVTVTRSAGSAGAATVDYATSDSAGLSICININGRASSRCDYETTIGTLHFAAGETSKTFSIPIINDSYLEGGELFNVSLSNPSGATLGSPTFGTINIVDNDAVTGPNPIDQAEFFVRQHYIDFLNREPDAPGLAFWSNQIRECQQPGATCDAAVRRINVSAAFFLSIEFQETGYLVERVYKSAYGDATGTSDFGGTHQLPVPVVRFNEFLPDTQQLGQGVVVGVGDWQAKLEANKVAFTQGFVSRTRFLTAYPTAMTPAEFVDGLFTHAGVTPSAAERTSIINEFAGAPTSADVAARARALRRVAENSALNQQEKNRAFVLMQYFGYLRRNPNDLPDSDYTGYDFWLSKLNEFGGNFVNAEMVKAFIISGEYRRRFGP